VDNIGRSRPGGPFTRDLNLRGSAPCQSSLADARPSHALHIPLQTLKLSPIAYTQLPREGLACVFLSRKA